MNPSIPQDLLHRALASLKDLHTLHGPCDGQDTCPHAQVIAELENALFTEQTPLAEQSDMQWAHNTPARLEPVDSFLVIDDSLTGLVIGDFRIDRATDLEMANRAVVMARVSGSTGATEEEINNGVKTRWAKVSRVPNPTRCPSCGSVVNSVFDHVDGCPGWDVPALRIQQEDEQAAQLLRFHENHALALRSALAQTPENPE